MSFDRLPSGDNAFYVQLQVERNGILTTIQNLHRLTQFMYKMYVFVEKNICFNVGVLVRAGFLRSYCFPVQCL